ncbi:DUF4398 domain-containing protein [Tahibacter amnicola]|uniref:DUF4398 domain-containing protein n=1 Tax=Tahibacter amnicola TaxID=2976241 RepID=A0ABY6BLL6_9GAMM|nr:DUF4398 domain-containing protein [Tahibacter amnicola]UXI69935.1 DUF4398 domain-containing protein [Tahibacter amnicola]
MKRQLIVLALCCAVSLPAIAANRRDAELALTEARTSVEAAERAGATEHAITDLTAARDNLAAAVDRADHRDWNDSIMASERTRADAILAEARSRQARAEATTREVEVAVESLRAQIH